MRAEASTGLDLLVNFYQEKLTKNPKRAPELHLKNTETRLDIFFGGVQAKFGGNLGGVLISFVC